MSQRLTRRDIKRDEVMATVGSAVEFVRDHLRKILLMIGLLVIAVLAFFGYLQVRESREVTAQEALADALKIFEAPIDPADPHPEDAENPSFADRAARAAHARQALESLRREYGGSDAADIGGAYLGELASQTGDLDGARSYWQEFLENQKGNLLASQVQINLMELDRAQGRSEELVGRLNMMLASAEPELPEEVLLQQLAITLERLGRNQEAHDAYRRIVDEYPASPYRPGAERQAEALAQEMEG